jgi:signal transduction histidine kinase
VTDEPAGRRRPHRGPPPGWRGGPPPWWPDNEPWVARRRRWRGFGCLFGILFLGGVLGLMSLAASLVGGIVAAPGVAGHGIRLAALIVVAIVVVALVRVGTVVRRTAAVLDELVDQAARLEGGDYSARVTPTARTPRPVRALVRGFNTMAERLEADETQRRRLIADVTHELRTPITVISGNVEAILDGVHPADPAHLTALLDETRVLGRLVEDLRTLALSEAGSLSLHREPTDLDVLCVDVATSFAAAASEGGVTIEADVDDNLPLLDVDPVRIREVLANLVANALRHTPAGGRVAISARSVPGLATVGDAVELAVVDTGEGIDAELLPHVFDRFARGRGSPGSGLGLSIARGLVELHGGSIAAESRPGGGTAIRIRLPVAG